MFFSKSFLGTLEQLSNNIVLQSSTDERLLEVCIQTWCKQLGVEEATSYIVRGFRNQGIKIETNDAIGIFKTERTVKILFFLTNYFYSSYQVNIDVYRLVEEMVQRTISNNFKVKVYLLCAFVIVAVGYALFLLEKRQQRGSQNENQIAGKNEIVQSGYSYFAKDDFVLLLVVNVKHEGIFRALKDDRNINSKLADELYHATQDLWIGSKDSFENSSINNFFGIQRDEMTKYSSEYDVYFIKITLSEKDTGFEKDVSQLKRTDAFKHLPEIAKTVEVSNRLPSQSYENIGVYSR